MAVNSEGIYGTRPYKIFGDGPAPATTAPTRRFNETGRRPLTGDDVRYTTQGDVLFAFVMDWPGKQAVIPSLATNAKQGVGKIQNVELLGAGTLSFMQDEKSLMVTLPDTAPCEHAVTFKISGALTPA
jgi:alpha-L-fucosidase